MHPNPAQLTPLGASHSVINTDRAECPYGSKHCPKLDTNRKTKLGVADAGIPECDHIAGVPSKTTSPATSTT